MERDSDQVAGKRDHQRCHPVLNVKFAPFFALDFSASGVREVYVPNKTHLSVGDESVFRDTLLRSGTVVGQRWSAWRMSLAAQRSQYAQPRLRGARLAKAEHGAGAGPAAPPPQYE